MPTTTNPNLLGVDWSTIPAPVDDGTARHLKGMVLPDLALPSTDGGPVELKRLVGRTVVFAYPRTGEPGKIALVDDWDMIPGARGCTPQTCAFRDLYAEFKQLGVAVYGLSTQDTAFQREAVTRLHVPFALLSDTDLRLTRALNLPTLLVAGLTLLKRMALVIRDGHIEQVFYPVFPPDKNAGEVLAWLVANPHPGPA